MRIFGIDFTSRPTLAKPIVCAECELLKDELILVHVHRFTTFASFETLLETPAPWVCGIDAPFAQPRRLIEDLKLPLEWSSYVSAFGAMGREGFVKCLNDYRADQPTGQKEHLRDVDKLAKAISPMKLYGVPVGKMFFELAPRLSRTSLNIPVLRPTLDERTVLEVYPSLVARALLGKQSYKSDTKEQQTDNKKNARALLVRLLESSTISTAYGILVRLTVKQRTMLTADAKGDTLDALLAGIQVAWAFCQKDFGLPEDVDRLEGWIADPTLRVKGER